MPEPNPLTPRRARGQEALEQYARRQDRTRTLQSDPGSVAAELIADLMHALPGAADPNRALRLAHMHYEAERDKTDHEWPTAVDV